MKEQIQSLIAEGRTEEALQLLVQYNPDAILLQARYNSGKRQMLQGLIENSEWARLQNQINYAAREMSNDLPSAPSSPARGASTTGPTSGAAHPKVFISYNHGDAPVARRVLEFLQANRCEVIIDSTDMLPGQAITSFIRESIKRSDAVVSIVSAKSLQSGWVAQESMSTLYAIWLADKKFIPLRLDDMVFDTAFQKETLRHIQDKILELDGNIQEIRNLGSDARDLEETRTQLFDLRSNISTIIQRFKSVLVLDIREPNFEAAMQKVLKALGH